MTEDVRDLAQRGLLAKVFAEASPRERRSLRRDAYELLYPVVFSQLTRRLETRRGHRDCASGVGGLRPACLDRFHDDMDAVLADLFRHATVPIHNLEGWVSRRLIRATVDAYRRRRGSRGALQRPRIPRWLARELRHDERLLALALAMLEWVGVEATAGSEDWPVQTWAAQRVAEVGDFDAACRAVTQDIATVSTAMRTNVRWYSDYIERPMGRKEFPVAHWQEMQPIEALGTSTAHDARMAEAAALAVSVITASVERGGADLTATVVSVIGDLFGSGTAAELLDRVPGDDSEDHGLIAARLADPRTRDRIIAVVLDLLAQ